MWLNIVIGVAVREDNQPGTSGAQLGDEDPNNNAQGISDTQTNSRLVNMHKHVDIQNIRIQIVVKRTLHSNKGVYYNAMLTMIL